MEGLRFFCGLVGVLQLSVLLYYFFLKSISDPSYYVSDALRDIIIMRILLTVTVCFQVVLCVMYVGVGGKMHWVTLSVPCGAGAVIGWVLILAWDESTSFHMAGFVVFSVSVSMFMTARVYHLIFRSHNESDTARSLYAIVYVTFIICFIWFLALRLSSDPSRRNLAGEMEWVCFMAGTLMFVLLAVVPSNAEKEEIHHLMSQRDFLHGGVLVSNADAHGFVRLR